MSPNIEKELAVLERMTVGQLQERYVEVFGEPVRSRHRQYLIRRLGWRLQANAEGKVTDMSELARLAHVTQPRMTQIMNLNRLAPEIQEQILFLQGIETGRENIHERVLRRIAALADWHMQRCHWTAISVGDHRLNHRLNAT